MADVDLDAITGRFKGWFFAGSDGVPVDVWDSYRLAAKSVGDVPALVAEVERLRAAVALHRPLTTLIGIERCAECGRRWPCLTARTAREGTDG